MSASNPNNCATCRHKPDPDGAWCYMFRDEPTTVCAHHTLRRQIYPSRVGLAAALDAAFRYETQQDKTS
jgi:hypothetical protein